MKKLVIVPVLLLSVILFLASCGNTESNASMKAPVSEKTDTTNAKEKDEKTLQKQALTSTMDTTMKKEKNEKGESEEDEAKEKAEHKSGEKKSVH
jgi:hypothetical protein